MEELENTYGAELDELDSKIQALRIEIDNLMAQRHRLLGKIRDIDMDLVLQIIVEKGLSSNEVLEIINNAIDSQ